MDGTLPKISFLKLQGRGAPITPWCWMGVDGMDLDRNKTQNIHIKVVLMRIKKNLSWFLSSSNMGIFLLTFQPSWIWSFWPCFTIQSQGIEQAKTLHFTLKVLWCSNNLMEKNEFYNPFYLWKYRFECMYFSKNLPKNFNLFQGFRQSYKRPVTFRAISSLCFRGSWLDSLNWIVSNVER